MTNKSKPRVVILGGGFGGLEAAFYLRARVRDAADITLISNKDYFLFKPNSIYVPFGLDAEQLKIGLEHPTKKQNIQFIQTKAREIDQINKFVDTNAKKVPFDFLVVATGAEMHPEEIPGLNAYAHTIWTTDNMLRLKSSFEELVRDARLGKSKRVLFLIPPHNKHPGPLYEMVLMLDSWLRQNNQRDNIELALSTCEDRYLSLFGPRLDEVITHEFAQRHITGYKNYEVDWVERQEVIYKNGEALPYDLLVAFPAYVASTPFRGLPTDYRGFVTTYPGSRRVIECPRIYAVGDTSNFPVKQAFLAVLQADAAAEHIAADILNVQPEFIFKPVSVYVLDEFDTATFAQVPMQLSDFYDETVAVETDSPDQYRVGSSPVWRLGKKLLGIYLPWRFKAGKPLHNGFTWKGMEAGLKVMSGVLAQ